MRITLSDRDPAGTQVWFKGSESMLAGAGAGLVSSVVTCPLDVVKTKLQASGNVHRQYTVSGTCARIWANEGFRGFYRGLGPTIIGYLPTWAIYFTVYDKAKAAAGKRRGMDDPIAHIIAAMTAGATSTMATNPLWVIKTRFMTQDLSTGEPRYKHTLDAIVRIYRSEGWRTFYRGLFPSLLGVSHIVVQFPLYERLKLHYRNPMGEPIPASTILFCSSASKMVASVATYPHEVLRTRLQVQRSIAKESSSTVVQIEGLFKTFGRIAREEGVTGFYRGMGVNLLRTVPSSAMTILTYELLMRQLHAISMRPH